MSPEKGSDSPPRGALAEQTLPPSNPFLWSCSPTGSDALPPAAACCQGTQTQASLGEMTVNADHRQTQRFGVICTLGLGQAAAPQNLRRVLKKQEESMSSYSSKHLKPAVCFLLHGKL